MYSERYMAMMVVLVIVLIFISTLVDNILLQAVCVIVAGYTAYCGYDRMRAWRTIGKPVEELQSLKLSREDLQIDLDPEYVEWVKQNPQ